MINGTIMTFEELAAAVKTYDSSLDVAWLQRVYSTAVEAHEGQRRASGESYVEHPLAVAGILAELEMDRQTIAAALLHDVVEDTSITTEQVAAEFGKEIASLVDGVTKLTRIPYQSKEEAQVENLRKMFMAMAKDIRVIIIKLADRLHNMRTLSSLPPAKQLAIARETLDIYTPIAHRLGIWKIKWDMEDLCLRVLDPERYREIVERVAKTRKERESVVSSVITKLNAEFAVLGVNAKIEGRPKHFYSIYTKMKNGRDFSTIYDLTAIRIIVDSVKDCYAALGAVHALWTPLPGRFKDYIAMPKPNMYQSLHTTVVGPEGKPLEVQIRTNEMHKTAEYGIAAHWRYKETKGRNAPHPHAAAEIDDMAWMRQLLDWQREAADPGEFLEALRYDLAVQEIFVFTPKGDLITLPTGSTPVDFAYAVHTEVGHRCIGARVNGRLVALERKLENGEVVEVFTSKAPNAGPSRDWQTFVVSPRAKAKIRQWFAKERREEALETGKDAIAREVRRSGLPLQRLMNAESMAALARELRYTDVSALYTAVGEGHVSARHVVQRLVAQLGGDDEATDELAERSTPATMLVRQRTTDDVGVAVPGAPGVLAKLAKCCTPVPGDNIMGFVTRGGGVSVLITTSLSIGTDAVT